MDLSTHVSSLTLSLDLRPPHLLFYCLMLQTNSLVNGGPLGVKGL